MSIIDQNDKFEQKVKFAHILPKWQFLTKSNFLKSGHFWPKFNFFSISMFFFQYNVYSMPIIDQNDKFEQKVKFGHILP